MKLKKIIALLLSGAMLAGVMTGCGGGGNSSSPSAAGSSAAEGSAAESSAAGSSGTAEAQSEPAEAGATGGTVEMWNDKFATMDQTQVDSILDAVGAASGYEIEMVAYPDTASYQTAMQQTIREKEAPGLFTWWSGSQLESLAENGLLEDLTPVWEKYIFDKGVTQDVADALSIDGKIYAAPWAVLYTNIIYNKTVFDEYNLEEPQTFDEFLEVCETLKSNGVTPIALKSDSWAGFIWFQQLLACKDVELYKGVCDGSIAFTDDRIVEVMEIWRDMLEKGYFSAPMDYATDMANSMANGETAMMLEPNSEFTRMKNDFGLEEGKDLDTFSVPTMDGGKKTIFFEVSPLCVAAASDEKEDALRILETWYTPDVQNAIYSAAGYANTSSVSIETPAVQEIIANTADTENYQLVLRYYENTPEKLRDFVLDELMKFQLMDSDVDTMLNTIQQKADEVFGK